MHWCGFVGLFACVGVPGCADVDLVDDDDVRTRLESAVEQADYGAVQAGSIGSARAEHLTLASASPQATRGADGWWSFGARQYRYSTSDGIVQTEPDETTDAIEIRDSIALDVAHEMEVELTVTGLLGDERVVTGGGSDRWLVVDDSILEFTSSWTFEVRVRSSGCSGDIEASSEVSVTHDTGDDSAQGDAIGRIDDDELAWWVQDGENADRQPPLVSRCAR